MFATLLIITVSMIAADPAPKSVPLPEGFTLKDLPYGITGEFLAAPYIAAAAKLRAAGEEATAKFLTAAVDDKKVRGRGVTVLCRMLYEAKPGEKFRRPLVGAPQLMGGTKAEDWPLEPITIVDGVPFVVVDGYSLGGLPESTEQYLKYCLDKCVWGSVKYVEKTEEERAKALTSLLASKTWKRPLSDGEKKILEAQIK